MTKCFHTASLAAVTWCSEWLCFDWSTETSGLQTACAPLEVSTGQGCRQVTRSDLAHTFIHRIRTTTGPQRCSFCMVALWTLIQGKAGEPGADGGQGPKGSRVSLHCPLNPALATQRFHHSLDILLCLCSLTAGGTWPEWPLRTQRPRRNQPLSSSLLKLSGRTFKYANLREW